LRSLTRALLAPLAAAFLAAPALASQAGFAFLEVPAGARAAAMGGAYSAVATGAEAAFWNPAGLADFSGSQFAATHTETWTHLRHDQAALAGRMFGGGIAASLRALYSEPIPERDDTGNLIGTFGSHDLEFLAGYARSLGGGLALGFTAQAVRERIADLAAGTWAAGAGASCPLALLPGARASLSVHNVGPGAHYTIDGAQGQSVPLPMTLAGGISIPHQASPAFGVLLSLEARATRGRRGLFAVGGELSSAAGAAIRFGLRGGDDTATWSAGAGWQAKALRIDYAFVPSRLELEDTHRFSLTASF